MTRHTRIFTLCIPALAVALLASCNSTDKQAAGSKNASDTVKTISKPKNKPAAETRKPAIINLMDTVSPKRTVVYIKDSAATFERISLKLGQIYGQRLAEVFKLNKLKATGPPMAWYKTQKAPYFFEAGMPVNKRPAKLPKGVLVRDIGVDSVIVAHFYGPYDLTSQAYEAAKDRMKYIKRKEKSTAYEIYITDPIDKKGKPVDPYKVQTDIVFPVY